MIKEKNRLFEVKDYILLGILVLVYSIIALYNLGSMKAPQTYWKPSSEGESFYVDFGEAKSVEKIYHFSGIGEGKYQVAFSNDAEIWEDAGQLNNRVFIYGDT